MEEPIHVKLSNVIIIEGSYSMRKDFRDYYDLKVLLDIDYKEQLSRLEKRNKALLHRFIDEWIPLENIYFETEKLKEISDVIIDTSKS